MQSKETKPQATDEPKRDLAKELKQQNEALKRSEEAYHSMVSEVQDYAIIRLDENGIIQNWNKGAENIKLYKEHEIIGRHFSVFYLPDDRQTKLPERLIEQARREGKASHEGWRKRKDGSKFWGSITITALHDATGKVVGFVKVTRDLTARKEAEERMLAYTKELEFQNLELEQFAYIASHDLQEPLRKIRTFSDIIRNHRDDPAITQRYLDKIDESSKRMSDLIRAVLNYSRLSQKIDSFETVNLNAVVESIKVDLELLVAERNATIMSDPLPVIRAIRLQMYQLFANLITNALKYVNGTPVVQIAWRRVAQAEVRNRPETLTDPEYIEIAIIDNGIGFEDQYLERIFLMFQRLHGKTEYSGTGIGLALCKRVMENHHGHITATSQPGQGSVFYVYFPTSLVL